MSSAVLEPGLFAYWYFLAPEDGEHAALLRCWERLRGAFGLPEPEGAPAALLEAALGASRLSPAPVPFGMAQGEGVQARLLALSDMVIVQLIRSAPAGQSSEDPSVEWAAFLSDAAELRADAFGEARVLVGTSDHAAALMGAAQRAFGAEPAGTCRLECGDLIQFGDCSHYLLPVTAETEAQCNAVASLPLPCLDSFLRKAERQLEPYQRMAGDLKAFSTRCDARCKAAVELLGERVAKERFHPWLDAVETMAHALAESHGVLVNNMAAVRDVATTVAVNLENSHKLIERIVEGDDDVFGPRAERVAHQAREIDFHLEYLEHAARNVSSALQAVQTKIGLIRSREGHETLRSTLDLLKNSQTVEAAAWLITLGVMGLSCLQGWQLIDHDSYGRFPPWFKAVFGLVGGSSALMTTDCLAKRRYVKLALCLAPFVIGIVLIGVLSAQFAKP